MVHNDSEGVSKQHSLCETSKRTIGVDDKVRTVRSSHSRGHNTRGSSSHTARKGGGKGHGQMCGRGSDNDCDFPLGQPSPTDVPRSPGATSVHSRSHGGSIRSHSNRSAPNSDASITGDEKWCDASGWHSSRAGRWSPGGRPIPRDPLYEHNAWDEAQNKRREERTSNSSAGWKHYGGSANGGGGSSSIHEHDLEPSEAWSAYAAGAGSPHDVPDSTMRDDAGSSARDNVAGCRLPEGRWQKRSTGTPSVSPKERLGSLAAAAARGRADSDLEENLANVENEELDGTPGSVREILAQLDAKFDKKLSTFREDFRSAQRKIDISNEKKIHAVRISIEGIRKDTDAVARRQDESDVRLSELKATCDRLGRELHIAKNVEPPSLPAMLSEQDFNRDIYAGILRIETHKGVLVPKDSFEKEIIAHAQFLGIQEKVVVDGDDNGNKFVLRFAGVTKLAACNASKFLRGLRSGPQSWHEFFGRTASGESAKLYINVDRNGHIAKTRGDAKKLARALQSLLGDGRKKAIARDDGTISVDASTVCKVTAKYEDMANRRLSRVSFAASAFAKLGIQQRELMEAYNAFKPVLSSEAVQDWEDAGAHGDNRPPIPACPWCGKIDIASFNGAAVLHHKPNVRKKKIGYVTNLARRYDVLALEEVHGTKCISTPSPHTLHFLYFL